MFDALARALTAYVTCLGGSSVSPRGTLAQIASLLDELEPSRARSIDEVLRTLARAAALADTRTAHPRYFGLPSASPTACSIAGASLAAALSTQLATFAHAPFAIEAERRLVERVALALGMGDAAGGQLTSGGQESNLTATLLALHRAFPQVRRRGVRAIDGAPTLYASRESHASLTKAARVLGLGDDAVRGVRVDAAHRMDMGDLRDRLARDRIAGCRPFLVVGTAGTTTAGAIDPLAELAELASREGLWFHVDAAWGGLCALLPETAGALAGVERADTVTFDPHKTMDVPLGAGMLLVRRPESLHESYAASAPYMPRGSARDPYASGLLWSRPFLGLRVIVPLAVLGWEGLLDRARAKIRLGGFLRDSLRGHGFRLIAPSVLPVALFDEGPELEVSGGRAEKSRGRGAARLAALVERAGREAGAWLSIARLPGGRRALRAGIVSHLTTEADVAALVSALADGARSRG